MRFLPLLGLLLLAAPLRAQTVSLKLENATPLSAIRTLFEQANRPYIFIEDYSKQDQRTVSLALQNQPFDQVLQQLLNAAQLTASERGGLTLLRRPVQETPSWRVLKALHQMQVRFAYDPLKEKVVVGEDMTDGALKELAQLSGVNFQTERVQTGLTLKIPSYALSSPHITADFRHVRLDMVGKTLGVAVEPACADREVSARLDNVPRQKALLIIASLTKTKIIQRGDTPRFEPAE